MKKLHAKKRKLNSKKGISLVIAIALVAVLFLTTTSFISIAMLQQNESSSTLNSRQAYVSSKSALDMAEDLLNDGKPDGKLTLPSTKGSSLYYVFYIDSAGTVHPEKFSSAEEALTWINNNSDLTIIGNAYVKITMHDDGSYTMTAVGKGDKYNNTNDGNTGDISVKFLVTKSLAHKPTDETMTMYEKTISNPPSTSENRFLMLNDQTAFSLMKSAFMEVHGKDKTTTDHNITDLKPYYLYRTLKQASTDSVQDNKPPYNVFYIPQLEAGVAPMTSYFPIVFDKVLKIDSNSNDRCRIIAYDNGIYLLGNYSGNQVNESKITTHDQKTPYGNSTDVCYYTNESTYGPTLECKYLVIGGNMVTTSSNNGITLKYSGSNYETDRGVVVHFTRDCTLKKYKEKAEGEKIDKNLISTVYYSKGYYYIPVGEDGVNLFDSNIQKYHINISNTNDMYYSKYESIKDIDMYSSMCESNGKLKDMHSAFESISEVGKENVTILTQDGTFNTGNNKTYSTNSSSINSGNYQTGYDNYYIYCAPSEMPSNSDNPSYYYMYSGKEFNYLWYNINSMEVNKNVNMTIQSNNVVLSIGPDQGEKVYYYENNQNTYGIQVCNDLTKSGMIFNGTEPAPTKTYTSADANKIVQKDDSASFCIKPYWNQSSIKLKVMNDFEVKMKDGTTYTVKQGSYSDVPSSGLNLFSDDAKNYFENHEVEAENAEGTSIKWVNSNNTINDSNPKLNQSNKAINFKATAGGAFYSNGTYKAKAIYCDFGNSTVKGNGATLRADVVSINAERIECYNKKGLWINTYSGYNATDGSRCVKTSGVKPGSLLHITRSDGTTLKLKSGMELKLEQGYYYFPDKTEKFDILNDETWVNKQYYYVKDLETATTTGTVVTVIEKQDPVDFEGKYF